MSDTDQQVDDPVQQEADRQQEAVERRARNMGWRPREEFRGDAERWLPADEYVERGERMLPILQERNRAADRQITELQQQVSMQGQTLQEMLASARKAEQVGYRRAMQELSAQRHRAVESGDTAAFAAVEQAIRELGPPPAEPPPPPPQPRQQPQDPTVAAWIRANPWFNQDRVANVAMIAAMQDAERTMPGLSVQEHLQEAETVIRRAFPHHFPADIQARRTNGSGNGTNGARRPMHVQDDDQEDEPVQQPQQRRLAPPTVSRSSADPSPRRPAPRSFEALPRDVQAQFERQRRQLEGKGDPFTKDEFARYYFEQEPE